MFMRVTASRRRSDQLWLDDPAKVNAILDEAHAQPAGLQGLLAALAAILLEIFLTVLPHVKMRARVDSLPHVIVRA
jgi:hypothetical protein